jgi:GNAT superfamily N-acetyltransferase
MGDPSFSTVAVLNKSHDREAFDCGSPSLNTYLKNYALQNQKRGIVRNYVTTHDNSNVIVAYYSLVYTVIEQKLLPSTIVKGLGRYDIPAMLLARLGVDTREQGRGLGRAMLKDAILRTMQAAEIAGLKLLLVEALDSTAAAFYEKHGFVALSDDPLQLYLPISLS